MWRDRYRQAAYRGRPFYVTSDGYLAGRKSVVFEAPGEDLATFQDLGRRAREFEIDAIFIGEDYDIDRDAFLSEVENNPSGRLDHPRYGKRNVVIPDGVRVKETSDDGGMCVISFLAVEVGEEANLPNIGIDTRGNALAALDAATITGAADFSEVDVNGSNFVLDTVLNDMRSVVDDMMNMAGDANQLLAVPGNYVAQLASIVVDAAALANTPASLFNQIEAQIQRVMTDLSTIADAVTSLFDFGERELGPRDAVTVTYDTPDRQKQVENRKRVQNAADTIQTLNVARCAVLAGTQTRAADTVSSDVKGFSSAGQSRAFAALMNFRLKLIISNGASDDHTQALLATGAALTEYLLDVTGQAPELVEHTPGEDLPACVVAQQLYGSAARADDVADRNGAVHPLMIPGGVPLEVIEP